MQQVAWRCSWEASSSPGLFHRPPGSSTAVEIAVQLPQGTIGLQLHSSARVCELYAAAPGTEPSYVSTCRGAQLPGQQLWALEHTWAQPWLVPPIVRLRLFSLLNKDEIHLASLQLLPGPQLQAGAAPAVAAAGSSTTTAGADWAALWEGGSAAGGAQAPAAAPARGAAGRQAASPAAAPPAAAGGSQMDAVRQMLSELAVQEASAGSVTAAADPKRALMMSLANAVLRQPAAPDASQQPAMGWQQQQQQQGQEQHPPPLLLQQASPLLDEWRRQQERQEQQQQQMAEALGRLEQVQELQQQQVAKALGRLDQVQAQQQRQVAEALGQQQRRQEQQQRQVVEALGRLEQRVAAVESLCHGMHGMLRQLLAQQQRTKQPMMAGIAGLGAM